MSKGLLYLNYVANQIAAAGDVAAQAYQVNLNNSSAFITSTFWYIHNITAQVWISSNPIAVITRWAGWLDGLDGLTVGGLQSGNYGFTQDSIFYEPIRLRPSSGLYLSFAVSFQERALVVGDTSQIRIGITYSVDSKLDLPSGGSPISRDRRNKFIAKAE